MRSHISYDDIVAEEAIDFISENTDMLAEAIAEGKDFDRNDIRDLDTIWHENIVDRAYSLSDATFIIDNSSNVESDRGLTEGQDHEEAQSTIAAFTFSNDVWDEAERIYKRLADAAEEAETDITIEDKNEPTVRKNKTLKNFAVLNYESGDISVSSVFGKTEDFEGVLVEGPFGHALITKNNLKSITEVDSKVKAVAKAILDEEGDPSYDDIRTAYIKAVVEAAVASMVEDNKPAPIEPGSDEERRELLAWMRASRESSRGGYPLGGSYIDARCGTLYGSSEHAYVVSDNELGQRLPHLRGKYRDAIKAYWDETFGGPTPTTAEEMLVKIQQMISDGAENQEFREVLPEIEAILNPNAPRL